MAKNMFKKYTESLTRAWTVGANVAGGTLVVDSASGQVGVTLAASGGSTASKTLADGTVVTYPNAGVGYRTNAAVVAVDGTWLFPVAGTSNGETVGNGAAGTAAGTKVYRKASDGTLTLTASGNTLVGVIDDGNIVSNVAPVKIGVGTP